MKFILAIIMSFFITNAYAHQDDRYFDSRAKVSTHKQVKVTKKAINKHYKYAREHRTRRVRTAVKYEGETYSPDPVQWVAKSLARAAGEVLGGRPSGCPHRFCGCALAIKIFGVAKRDLWLAANWLRFPRTSAAPGMVAARRGHVFQLQAHIEGGTWRVWDANSGGGRIRIHNRSIAGYTIVNPGSRVVLLN